MTSQDALLVEYQVCQQDINSNASNYWIIFGIFMSVSTILLGGVIYGIVASDVLHEILALGLLIVLLGIVIIFILVSLRYWLKRVNFIADINYERMREIEDKLGMERGWRVHGLDLKYDPKRLDDWNKLSNEQKERINKLSVRYPSVRWWQRCKSFPRYEPSTRNRAYKWVVCAIISIWVIFIIFGIVIWFCPVVSQWLLN